MNLHKNDIFAGRYRLEERLGAGGFGEVWKAFDKVTHKYFAIKIHLKGDSEKAAQDIVKEYTRVMHIHHDNLLTPSYVDITEGTVPYLVMELCNADLADKDLTEIEVWHLIRDVSSGLKRLAENKRAKERLDGSSSEVADPIVHQDIKPANILIRTNGMYAISDFGISKRRLSSLSSTNDDSEHTVDSAMTVDYAAPERFPRGKGFSVLASDIWSFGAMLFEIVEGRRPFAECGGDCLNPTIGQKIPEITRRGFSDELKQLIYDCMAKEPSQRPHADQLLTYAESVLKSEPRKVEWPGAPKEIKEDKLKRRKSFSGSSSPTPPTPEPDPNPRHSILKKMSEFWHKYNKTITNIFLWVMVGIVLGSLLLTRFGNEERKAWHATKKENNISSYKSYIENYPQGKHIADALICMIQYDNAEHNLAALNYAWNYSDPSNNASIGDYSSIHNEATDTIQAYLSRCSELSTRIVNTLSSYTFNYYYSKSEEMGKLKQLVPFALSLEIMYEQMKTYFSGNPSNIVTTGSCGIEYSGCDFEQPDINRYYNEILIPVLKEVDSVFCNGRSILYEWRSSTTAEYAPYYDSAIAIVNQYFSSRQTN